MAAITGTIYTANGGRWYSGSIGSKNGYVAAASNTSYRTRINFSITAPSTGYKISVLSVTMGFLRNGSTNASSTISGYLYTSDPGTSISGPPSGYVASYTTSSITTSSSGASFTLNFNVSALNWTTAKTLWIWFATGTNALYEIWTYKSANIPAPVYSFTEEPNGLVRIYTSSGWQMAIPYVYSSGWKQAIPYVYSSGWKQSG